MSLGGGEPSSRRIMEGSGSHVKGLELYLGELSKGLKQERGVTVL